MSARQNCQKKSEIAQFSIKNGLNDPLWSIFSSDLRVIDLKYFENFYGALSLYFWAFEATLESEYVSSQNADFNLWNVLTQIFRQKLKKSSEKGFSFILFKKEVFHFDSFPPYLGQLNHFTNRTRAMQVTVQRHVHKTLQHLEHSD